MSDLELILLDAATASLGTLKYRKQKIPNKAAWFDNKCKASRNIFHKDRKRHFNHKCPANRNALINSSKHYKQVIRTSGAKCKSEINYINSLNKRKPMENVNIETFYDFDIFLTQILQTLTTRLSPISQMLTLIIVLTRKYRRMKLKTLYNS